MKAKNIFLAVFAAIMILIVAGAVLIYVNSGYKETVVVYTGATNNKDGTSDIYFWSDDFSEQLVFNVETDLADRISGYREYTVTRQERGNGVINYKIDMPGIVRENSKKYSSNKVENAYGTVTEKTVWTNISMQGDQTDSYLVDYTCDKNSCEESISQELYDTLEKGKDIQVKRTTFTNKEGNKVIQYRIIGNY